MDSPHLFEKYLKDAQPSPDWHLKGVTEVFDPFTQAFQSRMSDMSPLQVRMCHYLKNKPTLLWKISDHHSPGPKTFLHLSLRLRSEIYKLVLGDEPQSQGHMYLEGPMIREGSRLICTNWVCEDGDEDDGPVCCPYYRGLKAQGRNAENEVISIWRSLVLTCQKVYDDIFEDVYLGKWWVVRQCHGRGLDGIRALRPQTLPNLTHLMVVLDINGTCLGGHRPLDQPQPAEQSSGDGDGDDEGEEENTTEVAQLRLEDWHDALRCVRAHLRLSALHLQVICNLRDSQKALAKRLLEPLGGVYAVSRCSVSLSNRSDSKLGAVAKTIARGAMSWSRPGKPFRLMDLPAEIRQRILSYTELSFSPSAFLSPLGDKAEWSPPGVWIRRPAHLMRRRHCFAPTPFCGQVFAAYAPSCRCVNTPKSLFLVCKTLLSDAQQFFLLRNRLVVRPDEEWHSLASRIPATDLSRRLERCAIPFNMLQRLRYLELEFPPLFHAVLGLQIFQDRCRNMMAIIDLVKDKELNPKMIVRMTSISARGSASLTYAPGRGSGSSSSVIAARLTEPEYELQYRTFSSEAQNFCPTGEDPSAREADEDGAHYLYVHERLPFRWHIVARSRMAARTSARWTASEIERRVGGRTGEAAREKLELRDDIWQVVRGDDWWQEERKKKYDYPLDH